MACEQIERLQKQSGGFGCYLCLAHEWANPEATKRSYELIAQRVFPEFQGHAAATRDAKERARAGREPLAERNMKAVEEMVAKHQAELAAKQSPAIWAGSVATAATIPPRWGQPRPICHDERAIAQIALAPWSAGSTGSRTSTA